MMLSGTSYKYITNATSALCGRGLTPPLPNSLYHQRRDYAALWSGSPRLAPLNRGWKPLPPGQELLLILRKPPAPKAAGSAAQSASGASTFLHPQQDPPGFPPDPHQKPRPHSPLSMLRLCAFAEQTSLPRTTQARLPFGAAQGPGPVKGEAAPAGPPWEIPPQMGATLHPLTLLLSPSQGGEENILARMLSWMNYKPIRNSRIARLTKESDSAHSLKEPPCAASRASLSNMARYPATASVRKSTRTRSRGVWAYCSCMGE